MRVGTNVSCLFPLPYVSAKLAPVVTENLLDNLETKSISLVVADNLLYNLETRSTLKMNARFSAPPVAFLYY